MGTSSHRHAFLLAVHRDREIVSELIEELDHPLNDVFLHVDAKTKTFSAEDFSTSRAGFFPLSPLAVNWGGYTQVQCALRLLRESVSRGPYLYYHFLQGSSFVMKTQRELHDFFERRSGTEFIEIGDHERTIGRVRYAHLFNERRRAGRMAPPLRLVDGTFLMLQYLRGVDRFKRFGMQYSKGFGCWSITQELAEYVLARETLIDEMLRHSLCGDEIFMQTMAWNSPFRDALASDSIWFSKWGKGKSGPKDLSAEDARSLVGSQKLFSRKYTGDGGLKNVRFIRQWLRQREADQ